MDFASSICLTAIAASGIALTVIYVLPTLNKLRSDIEYVGHWIHSVETFLRSGQKQNPSVQQQPEFPPPPASTTSERHGNDGYDAKHGDRNMGRSTQQARGDRNEFDFLVGSEYNVKLGNKM